MIFGDSLFQTIVLIASSYLPPLLLKETRRFKTLVLFWSIISLNQIVSLVNAFFFRTIGAELDAIKFHEKALSIIGSDSIQFQLWENFYINLLAFFYFWVGSDSIIIGQSISIIFCSVSLVLLFKMHGMLELEGNGLFSVAMMGLLPSMILVCPLTLRESYEIFFFMFSIYCLIRYLKTDNKFLFFIFVLFTFLMGMFHVGLSIFAVLLIFGALLGMIVLNCRKISTKKAMLKFQTLSFLFLVLLLIIGSKQFKPDRKNKNLVTSVIAGNILKYSIGNRHQKILTAKRENASATYGVEINVNSVPSFLLSTGVAVAHYFAAPFPWKANRLKDIYAVFENLWRIVLIVFSFISLFVYRSKRKIIVFLMLSYFAISFIWAMGTVNSGTAIRHHLVAYWLIVLLGVPTMEKSIVRFRKRILDQQIKAPE